MCVCVCVYVHTHTHTHTRTCSAATAAALAFSSASCRIPATRSASLAASAARRPEAAAETAPPTTESLAELLTRVPFTHAAPVQTRKNDTYMYVCIYIYIYIRTYVCSLKGCEGTLEIEAVTQTRAHCEHTFAGDCDVCHSTLPHPVLALPFGPSLPCYVASSITCALHSILSGTLALPTLSALPCCVVFDPCHTTLPHAVLALSSCSSLPCCGVCCRVCCRVCCKFCCKSCCRALQQSKLVENGARKIRVLQKHVHLSGSLHEATRWRAVKYDAWGSALFYVHLQACCGM